MVYQRGNTEDHVYIGNTGVAGVGSKFGEDSEVGGKFPDFDARSAVCCNTCSRSSSSSSSMVVVLWRVCLPNMEDNTWNEEGSNRQRDRFKSGRQLSYHYTTQ